MDFLISNSTPDESVRHRYTHQDDDSPYWIGYVQSGNFSVIETAENSVDCYVLGSLFGALNDAEKLVQESTKGLGRLALDSDGSFAVVIRRRENVIVVTDAGGSIPLYYAYGPDGFAVGTLVHHVATASGCTTIDKVSVVDYLLNYTVCYPYSWYEDVRVVPPGSVCSFAPEEKAFQSYWKPTEPENIYDWNCDVQRWGDRLRSQVSRAIRLGIDGQASGRVMYSGGSDSRAVLSLVPDSFNCTPTIVLDHKNREYRLAKRSAQLLGYELEWIPRPEGYYLSNIPERIDRIGPGWNLGDMHIYGSVGRDFEDADVVLGGYLADSLFKTHYMSNVNRRSGRPRKVCTPRPDEIARLPVVRNCKEHEIIHPDLLACAKERHLVHHERIKEIRPLTAGNWHRLWPLGSLRTYGHYLSCIRMNTRVIEPFLFHGSYQLAAEMPDPCRGDRKAFRRAFAKPMGLAGMWLTSGGDIPRLGGAVGSGLRGFVNACRIGVKKLQANPRYNGPWSADTLRNSQIRPEDYFCGENLNKLRGLIDEILFDQQAGHLFTNENISGGVKGRALALGFRLPGSDVKNEVEVGGEKLS